MRDTAPGVTPLPVAHESQDMDSTEVSLAKAVALLFMKVPFFQSGIPISVRASFP
jgi:hypothetical protein